MQRVLGEAIQNRPVPPSRNLVLEACCDEVEQREETDRQRDADEDLDHEQILALVVLLSRLPTNRALHAPRRTATQSRDRAITLSALPTIFPRWEQSMNFVKTISKCIFFLY